MAHSRALLNKLADLASLGLLLAPRPDLAVPLAVATERNRGRTQVVPDEVVRRFAERLEPPSVDEGFLSVLTVAPPAESAVDVV